MSSEAFPEIDPAQREDETEEAPPPGPDKPVKKEDILYMPGAKEAQDKARVEAEKPKGDPKTVLRRVRAYDIIRFARTGESGWHDAEVIGWVDKDHLKLQIIDNGEKTGRVMELHKSDIYAVDITEGAYDYLNKMRENE